MKNKFHSHFLAVALIAFIVQGLLGCSFTEAMNKSTPEPTIVNIPNNQKPTLISDQEGNGLATSAITLTPSPMAHDLRMRVSIIEELSTDEIIDFVWAPDGTSFAIAGRYNNRFGIALFTLNSEQPKWFVEYGPIFGLAFTSDGENVVFSWSIGFFNLS